ncbi:MAG: DUF1127 domain-containing protein [Pseudomonadota bacterium]
MFDSFFHSIFTGPARAAETLRLWVEVRRRRREMAGVSPRLLADMGISPEELKAEVERPFWDISEAEREALSNPQTHAAPSHPLRSFLAR